MLPERQPQQPGREVKTMKKYAISAVLSLLALVALSGSAKAVGRVELEVTAFALNKGVFNSIFAKELCSCQFVDGLTLEECKARDNLPGVAHQIVDITVDPEAKTVSSTYKGRETINRLTSSLGIQNPVIGGPATARFDEAHPEFGCVLTKLPSESAPR